MYFYAFTLCFIEIDNEKSKELYEQIKQREPTNKRVKLIASRLIIDGPNKKRKYGIKKSMTNGK
jgi:hypothetical protein